MSKAEIVKLSKEFLRVKVNRQLKEFYLGGDLDLSDTDIKELPKGLEVGGSLDLSHSKIKALPEGLKVGGLKVSLFQFLDASRSEGLKV